MSGGLRTVKSRLRVVEKCPQHNTKDCVFPYAPKATCIISSNDTKCHGTGVFTRPATMEEINEFAEQMAADLLWWPDHGHEIAIMDVKKALTLKSGRVGLEP